MSPELTAFFTKSNDDEKLAAIAAMPPQEILDLLLHAQDEIKRLTRLDEFVVGDPELAGLGFGLSFKADD